MISAFLAVAALVAPPDGPFIWRGREMSQKSYGQFFRVSPMREPMPVKEQRCDWRTCNDFDDQVVKFVNNPSAEGAYEVFKNVATCADTNRFANVSDDELRYLLRYAASRGHRRALEFFDEKGMLLTGREYDYVFAQYRFPWVSRTLGPETVGQPGYGCFGTDSIRPYSSDDKLQAMLDKYALSAKWFVQNGGEKLPFLEFTPKNCPTNEVPLVVYVPGSGEQGTNLAVQFKQRACLEKVVSPAFQKRHPCRLLIIALPEKANWNSGNGYPHSRDARSEFYNDMILAYARFSDAPKVDLRRIYLTGLGSGATIAAGMVLDHPGRFAAIAPVWHTPSTALVHPRRPGNWRYYNFVNPEVPASDDDVACMQRAVRKRDEFTANVIAGGGDCSFHYVPKETPQPWWNVVWSGDEIWEWLFSKTAPVGSRESF